MVSNKFLIPLLISLIISAACLAQSKGDNTVMIKDISFLQVCESLLDAGFTIEKKDPDLQTAETAFKTGSGKNKWMKLRLKARVKDSTAIITGDWYNSTMLGYKVFGQEQSIETLVMPIENTHGNPKACFKEMHQFALRFGKKVSYSKN